LVAGDFRCHLADVSIFANDRFAPEAVIRSTGGSPIKKIAANNGLSSGVKMG
jgi:hypothetical protein